MIISPCISICKTDPSTGYCYGCGRSNEEKQMWKKEDTSDDWKKNNLELIKKRLSGWQLESFNESYEMLDLFRKIVEILLFPGIFVKFPSLDRIFFLIPSLDGI